MEFDELVRQRLRDYIKDRSWSVSRFASRYVQAYAEAYSKMEAPGTSTARKLIEDKSHRLSEREAIVLDSFTGLNFHELWLEEQKQLLLGKTEQYVAERNGNSLCNTTFDSQTLLEGRIAALEKHPKALTLDDVVSVVRRYVDIATDKALFVWADSTQLLECVIDTISDVGIDGTNLSSVLCRIQGTTIKEIDSIITSATNQKGKVIYGIVSDDWSLADDVRRRCADHIISFHIKGNPSIVESLMTLRYTSNLHPMYANIIKRCMEARPDFPDYFKHEIECCLNSPWVKFPRFGSSSECMEFLTGLCDSQQKIISTDESLLTYFNKLCAEGLPDNWLMDDCDRHCLLIAMKAFDKWQSEHSYLLSEKIDAVRDEDFASLLLTGRVPSLSATQWEEWFTKCYYNHLVDPRLPQLLDVVIATERRKKSLKK